MPKPTKTYKSNALQEWRDALLPSLKPGDQYRDAWYKFLELTEEYTCCVLIKRAFFDERRESVYP